MTYTAYKHPYSDLVWADGTTIALPPITRSQNGWIYRPREAMFPGSGKSFGKGSEGETYAKSWLNQQITRAFERQNWAPPSNIPTPSSKPLLPSNTVHVGWNNPVFGPVHINMAYDFSRYGGRSHKLTLSLEYHVLARDIAARNIGYPSQIWHKESTTWEFGKDADTTETGASPLPFYTQFRRNPWGFTTSHLHIGHKLAELIGPHVPLPEVEYDSVHPKDGEEAWYRMTGNVDLLFEENARRVVVENTDMMDRVISAFAHLGIEVSLKYAYSPWGGAEWNTPEKRPTSLDVRVPAKKGVPGREETHTISFSNTGISVECGYVADHDRYVDYQQRKAMAFLEEITSSDEEWSSTEIQL